MKTILEHPASAEVMPRGTISRTSGALIINADDWGRDRQNTDRTLDCILRNSVSSVSAMVFMEDSERAAETARSRGIDAGLHLNFTTKFSAPATPERLVEHQQRIARYLTRHRLNQVVFHPGLSQSFRYVAAAQVEEFHKLYATKPRRVDGHHHMHLCANVLFGGLLPAGTIARRNFSFRPGEKGFLNRFYRSMLDRTLSRRHSLVDFLFSLPPLEPLARLARIRSLARDFSVEVETHPINANEYQFLTGGDVNSWAGDVPVARSFTLVASGPGQVARA